MNKKKKSFSDFMHNSLSPQRRTALYECLNYLNSMPSSEYDSKVSFPRRMKIPNISSQLGLDPLINTYRHSLSFVKLGRLCARSQASTACASRQYLREPHLTFGSQSLRHHFARPACRSVVLHAQLREEQSRQGSEGDSDRCGSAFVIK